MYVPRNIKKLKIPLLEESEVIRGYQRLSEVIRGYQRLSKVANVGK